MRLKHIITCLSVILLSVGSANSTSPTLPVNPKCEFSGLLKAVNVSFRKFVTEDNVTYVSNISKSVSDGDPSKIFGLSPISEIDILLNSKKVPWDGDSPLYSLTIEPERSSVQCTYPADVIPVELSKAKAMEDDLKINGKLIDVVIDRAEFVRLVQQEKILLKRSINVQITPNNADPSEIYKVRGIVREKPSSPNKS